MIETRPLYTKAPQAGQLECQADCHDHWVTISEK